MTFVKKTFLVMIAATVAAMACSMRAESPGGVARLALTPICPATFEAVADAQYRSDNPTNNKNTSTSIVGLASGVTRRAVVRWDLSSIPANATITSAAANFWITAAGSSPSLHANTSGPFVETTVSWATQPSYSSTSLGTVAGGSVGQAPPVSLDVAVVQGWLSANYGLTVESDSGSNVTIAMREDTTPAHRPSLSICYTTPDADSGAGGTVDAGSDASDSGSDASDAGGDAGGVVIDGAVTTWNGLTRWNVSAPGYIEAAAYLYAYVPAACTTTSRCKALYLLPAAQPSHDGIDEAKAQGLAETYGLILVGPDYPADSATAPWGQTPPVYTWGPWGTDSDLYSNHRYDAYVVEVVVPFVDATLPTLGTGPSRLLVGYSKSGHVAHTLLARHPAMFGRAGAWDGMLNAAWSASVFVSNSAWTAPSVGYIFPNLYYAHAGELSGTGTRFVIDGYSTDCPTCSTANASMCSTLVGLNIGVTCPTGVLRAHTWTSGWLPPMVAALVAP